MENLDRSGLFKPGEWVHVLTTRFTLYGPGINATTKAALIADFEFIMKTIIYHQTMVNVGNVSIVAESDFSGTAHGLFFLHNRRNFLFSPSRAMRRGTEMVKVWVREGL